MQPEESTRTASVDAATTAARKEIFEYLRNEQRSEEARSKSSGLTSWALIAATCLMIWEGVKLGEVAYTVSAIEQALRILAVLWPLYLSIAITLKEKADKALRFEGYGHLSFRAPIVTVASICWLFSPWIGYAIHFTLYAPITLIPAAILIGLAVAFIDRIKLGASRFPLPRFNSQARSDTISGLLGFLVILGLQINRDGHSIWEATQQLSTPELQLVLLIVAIYWSVLFFLDRNLSSFHSEWSTRIERNLLIGNFSNNEALRQIEQRTLGPRFSSVLEEFWSELDQEKLRLEENITTLLKTLEEVKEIPEEYVAERSDRLTKSASKALSSARKVTDLHKELRRFEKVALQKAKGTPSSGLLHAIDATLHEHERQVNETEKLIDQLEELTIQMESMGISIHLNREKI